MDISIIDDVLRTCAVLPAKARAAAAVHAALGSWRGPAYSHCRTTSCIPLRVSPDPGVRNARKAQVPLPENPVVTRQRDAVATNQTDAARVRSGQGDKQGALE
jgi:hypothetical protein